MPTNLADVAKQAQAAQTAPRYRVYTPRFFDSTKVKLTGQGKTAGLLCDRVNPANIPTKKQTNKAYVDPVKRSIKNGTTTYGFVPLFALPSTAWYYVKSCERPPSRKGVTVATDPANDTEFRLVFEAHALTVDETQQPDPKTQGKTVTIRNLTTCYRVCLVHVVSKSDMTMANLGYHENAIPRTRDLIASRQNAFLQIFSCSPVRVANQVAENLEKAGMVVNQTALTSYLSSLSLYDMVCERSEVWQTCIQDEVKPLIDSLATNARQGATLALAERAILAEVIARLESYNVALDSYRDIYGQLKQLYRPEEVKDFCRENLNLMLSDTMEQLQSARPNLQSVPNNPNAPFEPFYSLEQRKAIASTDPLTLVQAAAGTGKTTVIMGRVKYLEASGVNPNDITVISFTNAAADNVHDKDPNIRSMTIDSMITQIYGLNYPKQIITSPNTLMNCLDIYFPRNATAAELKHHLRAVSNNTVGSFTRLNRFVEDNFDKVVDMLERIQKTTLELEIVICHIAIDNMAEPPEVQSRYLIMDEVQDTSIFQFVYVLKYVHKHKEALYMVGDSSQTLFEFRFANPRALNVMESSGVFATYKLQTNYRSKQEILDLANTALAEIEANQYAHLRLTSNDLTPTTPASFQDHVRMHYTRVPTIASFRRDLESIIRANASAYIDECLARKEQITILAHTHKDLDAVQGALESIYPTRTIVNISPKKSYDTVLLSSFIRRYWNEVQFLSLNRQNFPIALQALIESHIPDIYPHVKNRQPYKDFLKGYISARGFYISAQVDKVVNAKTSRDAFMHDLQTDMISYESQRNSLTQSLTSKRNAAEKQKKNDSADFILSTIHTAKGLEWPNVLVIYRDEQPLDEKDKRMYYVALTRATKTEFVLAYERTKSSALQDSYNEVVQRLSNAQIGAANAPQSAPKWPTP